MKVGVWYADSSIMNGAGSPANGFVFLSIISKITIAVIPTKYAFGATHQVPPSSDPEINAICILKEDENVKFRRW